jgi:hypothetical protein
VGGLALAFFVAVHSSCSSARYLLHPKLPFSSLLRVQTPDGVRWLGFLQERLSRTDADGDEVLRALSSFLPVPL